MCCQFIIFRCAACHHLGASPGLLGLLMQISAPLTRHTRTHTTRATQARFSAASALFLIMELVSAVLFLPQLVDLADNLGRWYDCSYDGAISVSVVVDNTRPVLTLTAA